jgi:hypothetical protein
LPFTAALAAVAEVFFAEEVASALRIALASFAAFFSIFDFCLESLRSMGMSESDSSPIAVSEALGSLVPFVFLAKGMSSSESDSTSFFVDMRRRLL